MKSGLGDRNNELVVENTDTKNLSVSMKSGLGDRNNGMECRNRVANSPSQWSPVLETGTIPLRKSLTASTTGSQ